MYEWQYANRTSAIERLILFLLQSIENKLLSLFEISQHSNYRAVIILDPEQQQTNIYLGMVGDQNILILSNGEFGERLYNISKVHNKNTFLLEFPWGKALNLEKIETYLKKHEINIVAMVHHETSSGMLNPLEKIGALAKKKMVQSLLLIVSAVREQKLLIWKRTTLPSVQVQARKQSVPIRDYHLLLEKKKSLKN